MHGSTVAVEKRNLGSSLRIAGIVSGQVSGKDILNTMLRIWV